jgi:hypothetical protein
MRLLTATALAATAVAVVLASPLPQPRQATASPLVIDMAPAGQPPRQLDFSVEDGSDAIGVYRVAVGQSTRFTEVLVADGVTVSAVVTVSAATNSLTDDSPGAVPGVFTVDEQPQNATVSPFLQTTLRRETSGQPTRVTYLISFVNESNDTPVFLDNLRLNVYDIDSLEFVEFPNAISYFLASNTHLIPSTTGDGDLRFDAPDASTSTGSPGFAAYTTGRGEVLYPQVSQIELSFGVPTGGRAYEFDFSEGQPWISNGVDTRSGPLDPANPTVPGTGQEEDGAGRCGTVSSAFSEGLGTSTDPYHVTESAQLLAIATTANGLLSCHFLQQDDIDLSSVANWPGIGGGTTAPFTGTYDGDGNTISNLSISATSARWGLFRNIDNNDARIENLTLLDVSVSATSPTFEEFSFGALVGELRAGVIDNVTVRGAEVLAEHSVGGLIGQVVTGSDSASVTISNTHVSASATATQTQGPANVGGLVGIVRNGVSGGVVFISTTSAVGEVTGSGADSNSIGGLIGEVFSHHAGLLVTVSASFSSANTTGGEKVGGLIGLVDTGSSQPGHFWLHDSYAMGTVNSTSNAPVGLRSGGLIGAIEGAYEVRRSFAAGSVNGTDGTVGGLIGKNWGNQASVINAFWDTQTTGRSVSEGGDGKVTSDMRSFTTFDGAGWSIATGLPATGVWGICDGESYPFLLWQLDAGMTAPCTAFVSNVGGDSDAPPSSATNTPSAPPTNTTPTTTTVPTPVPDGGVLPQLQAGVSQVIENGEAVTVEVFVDNSTDLVLRGQRFELRLAGDCTFGCTIQTDANGRQVLTLEERGLANVSGEGFQPGSPIYVWLFSEPRFLGTLIVNADGTFTGKVPLGDITPGLHTLQVNGTSFDGLPRTANLGVIVNPAAPTSGDGALPVTGSNTTRLWIIALTLLGGGLVISTSRRRRINTH